MAVVINNFEAVADDGAAQGGASGKPKSPVTTQMPEQCPRDRAHGRAAQPVEGELNMTTNVARLPSRPARPTIEIGGEQDTRLEAGLLEYAISDGIDIIANAELRFGNWGSEDSPGFNISTVASSISARKLP